MLAAPTLVFALLYFPYLALGGTVQKSGLVVPTDPLKKYENYQDRVKTIFTDSYGAYKQYALGHDDVSPVSKSFSDGRNGWGATIVDAMTTMHIMGLDDLFTEAVGFASSIDFSKSNTSDTVSVFESTIRYVGALLSSYELSDQKYPQLVIKAKELADKLAFSWVGANDIPYSHIDFSTNTPKIDTSNIAEAGTLTLEWATLSKYTGNDTYRQLAEKSARHIAEGGAPLDGLPGQGIDPTSGLPVGGYVTWGGGSDSYFEYLIKYARLNNTLDPLFADSWRTAVDSSIHTLLKRSMPGNYAYLADYDDSDAEKIRHVSSHLACFHGGNWLFGGRLLDNQTIVDIGLQLVDACWNTYASTSTGIGPERFAFISADGGYTGGEDPVSSQLNFNAEHGFYITAPDYVLRPEVLESNFYAWRVTGNTTYLDRAALAVTKFEEYLKVKETGGYGGLYDVDSINSKRIDDTESFWYAEVLKYLYLTFDHPSHIDLDKYVFNTEAHPFKIPTVQAGQKFGTGKLRQQAKPSKTVPGDLPQVSRVPQVPLLSDLISLVGDILSS